MDAEQVLMRRVLSHGGELWLVGGAVRDEENARLAGTEAVVKDRDYLVTGVAVERAGSVFGGWPFDLTGAAFGVFKVLLPGERAVVDVAWPRVDVKTAPGHTGFQVRLENVSLADDLARRDLTVNALARNVRTGELVDLFGGLADLAAGVLRFVGDAERRILEDPLRALRVFRFAAKLDARLDAEAERAVRDTLSSLGELPAERVWGELWALLSCAASSGEAVGRAVGGLLDSRVLETLIPAFAAARGYAQGSKYHAHDLGAHLVAAVQAGQQLGASPVTLLALLLHDLGKPASRTTDAHGEGRYFGHEDVGAKMAAGILEALRAPVAVTHDVCTLIQSHMRLMPSAPLSDKAFRRFVNDLGPLWVNAVDHRAADLLAHGSETEADVRAWRAEMLERGASQGPALAGLSEATLALSGTVLMQRLNLTPGRALGVLKRALLSDVVDGTVANEADALLERARTLIRDA